MKNKNLILTVVATLGLISSTIAQSVPAYVPSNGLQAWWPFNGNADDESGNGNNGIVNGATLTTDRTNNVNSAYSFNGVNNSIIIPDSDSLSFNNNIFSISFWLNWNPNSIQDIAILGKKGSLFANYEYFIEKTATTNYIMTHTWNLGGTNVYPFPSIPQNSCASGVWEHYVISANGTNCNVYKNGVLLYTSLTPTIFMGNSTGNLTLGNGGGWASSKWMDGSLDDIGIWNRALSASEISSLYNTLPVGNNKISENNLLSVFPNPSSNKINLLSDKSSLGSNYVVYDFSGQIILEGKIVSENTIIDLESYAKGIYLLSIDNNKKQSFKLIRN